MRSQGEIVLFHMRRIMESPRTVAVLVILALAMPQRGDLVPTGSRRSTSPAARSGTNDDTTVAPTTELELPPGPGVPCRHFSCFALNCSHTERIDECEHGTHWDNCVCCRVCNRKIGEVCGGQYGHLGHCMEGNCSADHQLTEMGYNITGTCRLEPATCTPTPRVMLDSEKSRRICRNCSTDTRPQVRECGKDGRWYESTCLRKQEECYTGIAVGKFKKPEYYKCNNACPDPKAPCHGSVTALVLLTHGTARFSCEEGYSLSGREVLNCVLQEQSNRWNGPAPTCIPSLPCPVECEAGMKCDSESGECVCKSEQDCQSSEEDQTQICASNGDNMYEFKTVCEANVATCRSGIDYEIYPSRYCLQHESRNSNV